MLVAQTQQFQYDRRRNDDCENKLKNVPGGGGGGGGGASAVAVHTSIDIKNVEQFPSLMRGSTSDKPDVIVEKQANIDNIWTKNKSKLKEIITGVTDADVSRGPDPTNPTSTSTSTSTPTTSECSGVILPTKPVDNIYKAKVPTKSLGRDNIFLGAFIKHSESVLDDSTDTFYSAETVDNVRSIPNTSVLVDSCDTRYDRFYN